MTILTSFPNTWYVPALEPHLRSLPLVRTWQSQAISFRGCLQQTTLSSGVPTACWAAAHVTPQSHLHADFLRPSVAPIIATCVPHKDSSDMEVISEEVYGDMLPRPVFISAGLFLTTSAYFCYVVYFPHAPDLCMPVWHHSCETILVITASLGRWYLPP